MQMRSHIEYAAKRVGARIIVLTLGFVVDFAAKSIHWSMLESKHRGKSGTIIK
jgi:hypothetical protein